MISLFVHEWFMVTSLAQIRKSYILKQQWCLSVCVGSAWKIFPVTARSPEITYLNTLNKAFLTVSVFGHLEFACTGGVHQNLDMEFLRTWFLRCEISILGRTRCGFPRPKPGNFQDVGSSVFGDLEFALRVSKTQKDLENFRIWFSGHGFQDLGSQLWGLDFHTRSFQNWNLKTFRTWFSGCGISILGPGFHIGGFTWSRTWNFLAHDFQDMDGELGDFTVSEGHRHPLV